MYCHTLSLPDALPIVRGLGTADQAGVVGLEAASAIEEGALYLDMNSVAPGTKRMTAAKIDGAGGRYVDVAIMAPVSPQALGVPLLLAGPHAPAGGDALAAAGFTNIDVAGARIGDASAVRMIRSVFVKGMEALTAEAMIARSEEHTSELQSLMRISYAVLCLKKKKNKNTQPTTRQN